ncbi:MAG TPA: O-antigen polymerase [Terracidiphilus sp.]|nr:O-antigen polymerase [Terracidiphilus sp.]
MLHPAFLFCGLWCSVAVLYLFCPVTIDSLSWSACALCAGGAFCFSLGCVLGNRGVVRNRALWFVHRTTNPQPRRILLVYSLFTLPLFVRDTARMAGGFAFSAQFIISARDALIAAPPGQTAYSNMMVSTAPMISILCAWLFLMEEDSRVLKSVAVVQVLIMCLLSTGRNMLLQFLVGWAVIAFLRVPNRNILAIKGRGVAIVLGVVTLLTVITLVTKRETQGGDAVQVAGDLTVEYIAGPLAALSFGMDHVGNMTQGTDPHGPVVNVPFPTNVYTFYQNYYIVSGVTGCLLVAFLIGAVNGGIFHAAICGNRVAAFFMAYIYYALALSIFSDAYGLVLRHVEVIAYAALYFGVLRWLPPVLLRESGATSPIAQSGTR